MKRAFHQITDQQLLEDFGFEKRLKAEQYDEQMQNYAWLGEVHA